MDITEKEMQFILLLFKSPEKEYNAHSVAPTLNVSSMGALKIAKRLEKEHILTSKRLGKAIFYKLDLSNEYSKQYIAFLLKREAQHAHPYVKRWVTEIQKIKRASVALLFGSILQKHKEANDIDILLVTDDTQFPKLRKEIEAINFLNNKKIHPIYQTEMDFINNIKKEDKIVLNALKGIVVFGEGKIIEVMKQ